MRAALQVQTELDLVLEVGLEGRERRGEVWIADHGIDAQQNDCEDEQSFPLQIRVHG